MKSLLPLALLASPALAAQGYPEAMPDVARVTCQFRALTDPATPARRIEIRRSGDAFAWIEDRQAPLPLLAAMRRPTGAPLTSFVAPVSDGAMALLTYTDTGSAELSRHGRDAAGYAVWTTQLGQCHEEKGN